MCPVCHVVCNSRSAPCVLSVMSSVTPVVVHVSTSVSPLTDPLYFRAAHWWRHCPSSSHVLTGGQTRHSQGEIFTNYFQISEEALAKRTAYLKQQRDKLLAMKKAEREKQLADAEASQGKARPKVKIFNKCQNILKYREIIYELENIKMLENNLLNTLIF